MKCSTTTVMHDVNLRFFVHLYTNASNFVAELVITQFKTEAFVDLTEKKKIVEVFILYDFFVFTSTRKCYSIYKKKLYIVVIFAIKYVYFCKHLYQFAVIHTNHRLITHFLTFDMHEEIYDNWTDKLRFEKIQCRNSLHLWIAQ